MNKIIVRLIGKSGDSTLILRLKLAFQSISLVCGISAFALILVMADLLIILVPVVLLFVNLIAGTIIIKNARKQEKVEP